jgi:Aminopeptidase C
MAYSQYKYEFKIIKENPATPVKDQAQTGTCWCFATCSFLESELIRAGKGVHNLSEMYIVRENYVRRINDNYIRRGKGNISQGSVAHMCTWIMDRYGLLPQEVYGGIKYDSKTHNHNNLVKYVESISKTALEIGKRVPDEIINGVLDAYLGEVPNKFVYRGIEYTPKTFYTSTGLKADNYVEITSFTHHPFYEQIPVEVPDNWDNAKMYNLPLDEMIKVMDNAINNGYTIVWDGDVSENGYAFNHSIALNTKEPIKGYKQFEKRIKEIPVTQKSRQDGFENFSTTDDHLEHITGIAKDQEGTIYYKTKNSWGENSNKDGGYHYMSLEYIKAKTISIMVNKNSIPKDIREKLGIK